MDLERWWIETHDIHGFASTGSPDEAIAQVAARTGGVVDRLHLGALELGRGAIEHRMSIGRLRKIHHGVYGVGHEALTPRGRLVAGLLAAGPCAALSHRTAAGLWKLTSSTPPFVEITARGRPRSRAGLVLHSSTNLEATRRHHLPVATPMRTLRDLAATRPHAEVERACSEALVLQLVTQHLLATQHGPGAAVLARIARAGVAPTRSELERRFLKAMLKFGLPRPETQHRIGRCRVDFFWPSHNLVVETDGASYHGHVIAVPRDHARDAELQLRGCTILRFTWWEVTYEPAKAAARVARFLSRPASRTKP